MANTSDKSSQSGESPRTIGVRQVKVSDLEPNPHNPRVLFDKEPLDALAASVDRLGILVPLTVYFDSAIEKYTILDGQRRWIVAQRLGLDSVPVNEVEQPSLIQNIVTMFQIHKLREDWELMPTALKLELLIKRTGERGAKSLAALTGLDKAVVERCKKLLSYDRKYQDMMLAAEPKDRIRADFFIELYPIRTDRMLNSFDWFSKNAVTDIMLRKYLKGYGLRSVTDFRSIKQHVTNARRAGQQNEFEKRFIEFLKDDTLSISHLALRSASVDAQARQLTQNLRNITSAIREIDVPEFYGEEDMWRAMEELLEVLQIRLDRANRRMR